MRAFLRACLVALPLLAAPSLAQAWTCPPVKIDAGVNAYCNAYIGNWGMGAQLGPWYTYWPYNAHFQSPAPVGGWPFWPTSASAVPHYGAIPSNQIPKTQPTYFQGGGVQPIGYSGQAPSYWYGH
jgi:hypothetical protein